MVSSFTPSDSYIHEGMCISLHSHNSIYSEYALICCNFFEEYSGLTQIHLVLVHYMELGNCGELGR